MTEIYGPSLAAARVFSPKINILGMVNYLTSAFASSFEENIPIASGWEYTSTAIS